MVASGMTHKRVPDMTSMAARRLAGFGNRDDQRLKILADFEIGDLPQ